MENTREEGPAKVNKEPVPQRNRLLRDIIETVLLTLVILLVVRFTVQHYYISGPSMEPSLHNQEYILVNKLSYLFHGPSRGDIIVFHYPKDTSVDYVKRIIAVPGDTVSVVGDTVTVDGVVLNEPYTNKQDQISTYPPERNIAVGANDYFVLGDNRGDSSDSRDWGFVPRSDIVGQASVVFWPFGSNNFGLLPNFSSVFAKVK